jgi:NarL family two-component system sensor histidine kinase LiaS
MHKAGLPSAHRIRRYEPAGGRNNDAAQAVDAACAAAQAERRRLSRDLRDSVSATLLALQWTARAIAELWDTPPAKARAALDTLCSLAIGAATEMSVLLLDLRGTVLEQQGRVAAPDALRAVVRQRCRLQVELRVEQGGVSAAGPPGSEERFPWAQEEALYCAAREALICVVKHAQARRASVSLVRKVTARLEVEDDGVSFGAPAPTFSYGLAGMRERVRAQGGRLLLEKRPGGGARG